MRIASISLAGMMCIARIAIGAQAEAPEHPSSWLVTVTLGGFVSGNRGSVTSWLKKNGYGVAEPPRCGFDLLLHASCAAPETYPKVSESGVVGWTFSVRKTMPTPVSFELATASEQSASVMGRCDDQANPRDARCTDRFITVDIGGASIAALAVVGRRGFQLSAGPALLLANWQLEPSHLTGVWMDATYGGEGFPLFLRAQYRFYKSTGFRPSQHFTTFHPSTLFVGGGITVGVD